jgi:hypothetical protein
LSSVDSNNCDVGPANTAKVGSKLMVRCVRQGEGRFDGLTMDRLVRLGRRR